MLQHIYEKAGLEQKSFIKKQPVYEEAQDWQLSFKDQAEVDMLDIEEDGCYYRISSKFRKYIIDVEEYAKSISIAWTHSTYCNKSAEVFEFFDKKIFIVRDPRNRALSAAKFEFTPYMQSHYPSAYASPDDFLKREYQQLIDQ